jgi:hypothetical protein
MPFKSDKQRRLMYMVAGGKKPGIGGLSKKDAKKFIKHSSKKKGMFSKGRD